MPHALQTLSPTCPDLQPCSALGRLSICIQSIAIHCRFPTQNLLPVVTDRGNTKGWFSALETPVVFSVRQKQTFPTMRLSMVRSALLQVANRRDKPLKTARRDTVWGT